MRRTPLILVTFQGSTSLPGFDAVIARFETRPAFNRQWRDQVILPPIATNRKVIYERIFKA